MKRFLAGLALGCSLTLVAVYGYGEPIGAKIISLGVQLANAGSTPLWEVQIRPLAPESPVRERDPKTDTDVGPRPVARPVAHRNDNGRHSR